MSKVVVISEECTSCNLCVDLVPEVFVLDANDLCIVKDPKGADEAKIQDAIDSCPAQCIKWE